MQQFILNEPALPIGGVANGAVATHNDSLYLLDPEGQVLFCRGKRKTPGNGASFFKSLGTVKAEQAALERTLQQGVRTPYLMQCGPVPVLVLRYFYTAHRCLLAVIPDEPLFTALRTPAAYGELLTNAVAMSPLSAAKRSAVEERLYHLAQEWALPYVRVTAGKELHRDTAAGVMQQLMLRTTRLAHLLGVDVSYDFSGIGYGDVSEIDYPVLSANLSAVLATAAMAGNGAAYLAVERKAGGTPMVYARLTLAKGELPLLEPAVRAAKNRGMAFEVFFDAAREGLLHIRFSFSPGPFEEMGLRNPFYLQN